MTNPHHLNLLLTAQQQARIAVALYAGREQCRELASRTSSTLHWFDIDNVTAAALVFRDHVHLTVCGSNDAQDWDDNRDARHVRFWDDMRTHKGFSQAEQKLLKSLHKSGLFRELAQAKRPLIFGGHSAGGAIAQLLALDIEPREVITFGAPRALAPASATEYASKPWRTRQFVMSGDPVPHMPLRKFRCLFGKAQYAHTSAALHLSDAGDVLMEQEAGPIDRLADVVGTVATGGLAYAAKSVGLLPAVMRSKHAVERYAAAVDLAVARAGG